MAASLHIYSIPECLTDEEIFADEDHESGTKSTKVMQKTKHEDTSGLYPTSRFFAASCNDINLVSNEDTGKSYHSKRNIKSQVSTSLINIRDFHPCADSGTSEKDNSDLFTNVESFNKNAREMDPNPYQEVRDYNTNGDSPYETLLVQHRSETYLASPQQSSGITSCKSASAILDGSCHYESLLVKPSQSAGAFNSNKDIPKDKHELFINVPSKSDSRAKIKVGSEKPQSVGGSEVDPPPQRQCSRGRSGSVQWIHNIIQNIDQKCRSFLDLRRPSDIAEEGIRNSNEEIEPMEHSDEESSKNERQSTSSAGRRLSENVIGKQHKTFLAFSSGFGHLKGLWRDRSQENNKKQDLKDIDQLRPDVCPLFNFPRKSVDEDEMILDALRQAMRKCTVVDPSARPPSSSVFEQLSQIVK